MQDGGDDEQNESTESIQPIPQDTAESAVPERPTIVSDYTQIKNNVDETSVTKYIPQKDKE